jgi:hypothetical protein
LDEYGKNTSYPTVVHNRPSAMSQGMVGSFSI